MIAPPDVMPLLLDACPSFASRWAAAETDNLYEDEATAPRRLHYMDAGDFVQHVVQLRLDGDTSTFPAIFDVIERLLVEGDAYVRNLGTIGYVEGFQMLVVTAAGLDAERDFRPWLRPESERAWAQLNEFWTGRATPSD